MGFTWEVGFTWKLGFTCNTGSQHSTFFRQTGLNLFSQGGKDKEPYVYERAKDQSNTLQQKHFQTRVQRWSQILTSIYILNLWFLSMSIHSLSWIGLATYGIKGSKEINLILVFTGTYWIRLIVHATEFTPVCFITDPHLLSLQIFF